ncbi:hypothetical protein O181_118616 [Austropuccinia psidii MF-1]|uniref:Uncharacterized protein n=1 Tax=Austropuccinia psidii MF-1 TaxID=1389203 RepID=A0A9Q3PYZ4_9BASI|nr:hypothetical protein [Austropuccinia psidii MF-1]
MQRESDPMIQKLLEFAVQTQVKFDDLKRDNKRLQKLTTLQEAIIKSIQESCGKLRKPSEETNKRLNQVFEEKDHCNRDRDCLDQDIRKLLDVYQNMKPQPQAHVLDSPYHQDIKPDFLL